MQQLRGHVAHHVNLLPSRALAELLLFMQMLTYIDPSVTLLHGLI
jgi:hypothetical protein